MPQPEERGRVGALRRIEHLAEVAQQAAEHRVRQARCPTHSGPAGGVHGCADQWRGLGVRRSAELPDRHAQVVQQANVGALDAPGKEALEREVDRAEIGQHGVDRAGDPGPVTLVQRAAIEGRGERLLAVRAVGQHAAEHVSGEDSGVGTHDGTGSVSPGAVGTLTRGGSDAASSPSGAMRATSDSTSTR